MPQDSAERPEIAAGDVVEDRDAEDPSPAVVLNPDAGRADAVEIPAIESTVAEANLGYDPAARVVVVVFVGFLDGNVPGWRKNELCNRAEAIRDFCRAWDVPLRTYSYPAPRLRETSLEKRE